MDLFYPFLVSFILIFISELGDKTQLLVLSFSTKNKAKNILLGVALGSLFSHGIAIFFGSKLGSFQNETFQFYMEIFTYISFLLFGILGFIPEKEDDTSSPKTCFFQKISNFKSNYVFVIALNIALGELGDKTFLASVGLGLQYPNYKLPLVLGVVLGMVASNSIALFFGKFLGNKFNPKLIEFLSNLLFVLFGIVGLVLALV